MVSLKSASGTTNKAFTIYIFAYVIALFVAVSVGYVIRNLHPILIVFIADISGTLVVYTFGRIFHNASFYDAYWSIAPLVISLFWVFGTSSDGALIERQIIVVVFVFLWGLRLTYNWARQWQGLNHEDWRYQDLRKKAPGWFWIIDLVGIEIMPTIIVFMACLSLYSALAVGTNPFGPLDIIAIIITTSAIGFETIADEQLRRFILKRPQAGEIMTKGLWAYSRHPNYFGEVMFWWGIFFFALAADSSYWWTVIGPVLITILFTTISIPLMEKRSLERRPGYGDLRKKVSVLFPWFPRV